ncbi:DUF5829 family protein [Microbulbifer guangxiensis]|uniref:DUF5829 family protein n=1 Tax=Microbulbifer guangxiensis TaxID=2904249 RepID=UPI001F1A7B7B|nr:DUF5829 family protein [Microbulbifer guangxiensis]
MKTWNRLAVLALTFGLSAFVQASPKQTAFLNHLFAVLDQETIQAIEQSKYLPEFIEYEKLVVTAEGGESWTGRYVSGRSTYVEFFSLGDYGGYKVGDVGLAISPEVVGGIDSIERYLVKSGASFSRNMRRRNFDGVEVDWFHTVGLDAKSDRVTFWAMEYVPSYLDNPAAKKEPPEGEGDLISRERYLGDEYREKLVRDVSYVAFNMEKHAIDQVMPMFLAGGYKVAKVDGKTRMIGQEEEIVLIPAEKGRHGLAELKFTLNSPVKAQHVERIGNSELRVGPGLLAVWKFTVPEAEAGLANQ